MKIWMIFFLMGTFASSWFLTGLVKRYLLKNSIVDIPNQRSLHTDTTPRGGGLAFVLVFIVSVGVLAINKIIPHSEAVALCGGGTIIAITGWMDDKNELTAKVRLVFHFIAAAWVLYWLGGLTHLDIGFLIFQNYWVRNILALVGIVWMINLYNFMDGVDGLAGIEAICVSLVAGVFLYINGSAGFAMLCLVVVFSVSGFLIWNWPPASIFMGDAGSGFLGLIFATLAIASENTCPMPLFVWILLMGVFVVDATATLIRRVYQGEKWYEGHRTHVYQLAVQAGYTHKQVTLSVLGVNIILALMAYITVLMHLLLWVVALTAAMALLIIHIKLQKRFSHAIKEQALRDFLIVNSIKTETISQAAIMVDINNDKQ